MRDGEEEREGWGGEEGGMERRRGRDGEEAPHHPMECFLLPKYEFN